MAEICKTDLRRLVRYLEDAAAVYAALPGQRHRSRRQYLLVYASRLKKKLRQFHAFDYDMQSGGSPGHG